MSLFEKTHIGQLEVKNHFIRSATYEGKATIDGRPTEAIIELYEKLAKGKYWHNYYKLFLYYRIWTTS